jgi:frataxin-like iron-binding protein CyaY
MTLPNNYQSMIEDTFDAIMDSFYMNIKPLREEMLRVEQDEDEKIIFITEHLEDAVSENYIDYEFDDGILYLEAEKVFNNLLKG